MKIKFKNIIRYIVCFLFTQCIFGNYVYWEPEIPIPGDQITVYYNTIDGALPNNTFPAYIHLGYNGWEEVESYLLKLENAINQSNLSMINDIFKKLRVAHKLRDDQIVKICDLVDY